MDATNERIASPVRAGRDGSWRASAGGRSVTTRSGVREAGMDWRALEIPSGLTTGVPREAEAHSTPAGRRASATMGPSSLVGWLVAETREVRALVGGPASGGQAKARR